MASKVRYTPGKDGLNIEALKNYSQSNSSEKPAQWRELFLVWVLSTLVLLVFLPNILDKLNPVTGDEPFYLVTAISLLQDHDINEANNYANHDYWQFSPSCQEMSQPDWGMVGEIPIKNVPGVLAPGLRDDCDIKSLPLKALSTLPPHNSKGVIRPGMYTKHGLGLSFLIAPAYALGNRPMVVVFIIALTALLGVNLWLLAFEITGKRRVAWITWLIMQFSAPLLCFAFLIFPATPAALFLIYSWRRIRLSVLAQKQGFSEWQPNGPFRAFLIGSSLALLPWLHSLYLSLSIMLFLYWWWGGRSVLRTLWQKVVRKETLAWPAIGPAGWSPLAVAWLLVPLILSGALFCSYYLYYYGSPLPNTQDHAGFAQPTEIPFGLMGLLFDQKYGLLVYCPLYLLALSGLWLLWQRKSDPAETNVRRNDLTWIALVSLPYLLIIADYNQWWGEWCPPARYLVPILPLLAVPLAMALTELNGKFFKAFLGVAGLWTLAASALFMYNPHLMYNWQTAKPAVSILWLEANFDFLTNFHLARLVPSYVTNLDINGKQANWLAALIWLAAAVLVSLWLINSRREEY
ncbi:MAG TPA: hypothetical protein VH186_19185 [Chloroflexia bacterium]|nr:hypothetical protein [Chloroflexia bacterium]